MHRSTTSYDNHLISSSSIKCKTTIDGTKISLNPNREEVLGTVNNIVDDCKYPYRTFMVHGTYNNIATLSLSCNTSYSITMESICNTQSSTLKIIYEWIIRYTDTITYRTLYTSRHIIGEPIDIQVQLHIANGNKILISTDTQSTWISKISIIRLPLLHIA